MVIKSFVCFGFPIHKKKNKKEPSDELTKKHDTWKTIYTNTHYGTSVCQSDWSSLQDTVIVKCQTRFTWPFVHTLLKALSLHLSTKAQRQPLPQTHTVTHSHEHNQFHTLHHILNLKVVKNRKSCQHIYKVIHTLYILH